MKCFICGRRIWFFQRRTRITNPAIRKLLAIASLLKEEDAGYMHADCQLGVIYTVLDAISLAVNAMEGYLGFIKKREKEGDEEKKMVIEVRKGVVEMVRNLPEGWIWDVEYFDSL